MFNVNYNPDVLTCLANLSNDEVFTPPDVANKMLDQLPQELWSDKNTTFLDPCTKSGIFLREITKRLLEGLKDEIPELQERINHILTKQVFGIGITHLTALLSRRSLYCSKNANQQFSITDNFKNDDGNIFYKDSKHKWKNLKCEYCGASKNLYNREDFLEQHAYNFIHTDNPKELFNMKFDVIIGNPPYQMSSGGNQAQAKPIYQHFIKNSKKLDPQFLVMIIPSRWFAGGMGLDNFRNEMLSNRQIKKMVDFVNSKDIFPVNHISGGVNYFLWEKNYDGLCEFTSNFNSESETRMIKLDKYNTFVRFMKGADIIEKIRKKETEFLDKTVGSLDPFGIKTSMYGSENFFKDSVYLYSSRGKSGYIPKTFVQKGENLVNRYKVIVSITTTGRAGEPTKTGKFKVFSSLQILKKNEVCTFSYFVLDHFDNIEDAEIFQSYMNTKFVRFLVLMSVSSIHLSKDKFGFVPSMSLNNKISDKELYKKYNLNAEEIDFIESLISTY